MEPQIIPIVIEPQDVLGQIISRRTAQLEAIYPEFKGMFGLYQNKIKDHAEQLKPQKQHMNDELFERVVQELQLQEHNLRQVEEKSEKKKHNKEKCESTRGKSRRDMSSRSSETSEMGFKPYKISNFSS